MDRVLVLGGTGFIGRHLVAELLDHEYTVATVTRGRRPHPFEGTDRLSSYTGDRTVRDDLKRLRARVDPDLVVDTIGYVPDDVRMALDVFEDCRYVFISSVSAYAGDDVPYREESSPLRACSPEEASADTAESYGARKAECDRAIFAAAAAGVDARSVRPVVVYGPHDHTERFAYWTHRVASYDRVVVPGDGSSLIARAYVEDVAFAIRLVAERGEAGEAYNVADRDAMTLQRSIEFAADALAREVEVVGASPRELAVGGLTPADFVLYTPTPLLAATEKVAALGWRSTPLEQAVEATVTEHEDVGRRGAEYDPGREAEEAVLAAIDESMKTTRGERS